MLATYSLDESARLISAQGGCNGITCCDCIFYQGACPESPEAMRASAEAWLVAHRGKKKAAA